MSVAKFPPLSASCDDLAHAYLVVQHRRAIASVHLLTSDQVRAAGRTPDRSLYCPLCGVPTGRGPCALCWRELGAGG